MKILLATHNQNKAKEIKNILPLSVDIITLKDLLDEDFVIEDGKSFVANATKKAKYFATKYNMICLADDSGLSIQALRGLPGVDSKDFSLDKNESNCQKVLRLMKDKDDRRAYFTCILAFCQPNGECRTYKGIWHGKIAFEQKGQNGFEYDCIFIPNGFDLTVGQLDEKIKAKFSHRAVALSEFILDIKDISL